MSASYDRAELSAALLTALRGIKRTSGYQTDVQSVLTGRPSLVSVESLTGTDKLPLLTVNTRSEAPEAEGRSTLAAQSWARTVVIQAFARATETWDADLDHLADDLRRCLRLAQLPARCAEWGEFTFYPPDPDSRICLLQAELRIVYVTTVAP